MSETGALASTPTIPGETASRVALTPAAISLLQQLAATHGPLMFHQSGGCCDGSAPMCYPAGEFMTGDADVLLGVFELPGSSGPDGTQTEPSTLEFWMSREQFRYWEHTRLTVDVVDGRGAGFSLEAPEGKRFLIRSELVDPAGRPRPNGSQDRPAGTGQAD
ncbi:hypothetical protein GCM10011490_03540 [Pseudoclavibacter endophyticus]|uniref:DUF779 domain-containing protein n=1 Tax=Pseudoclavibacter endophyticus TaxID=1778590 RepID=A0A6H9WLU0_9MICO|nr:DUF779 domain-containing protein [Pseudoclavibacter endophyticus]KAB1650123.1 DUF779 domain-containing protein [Pseudoclavibacter endophyticus]GGA57043.1 hypothetical protein GCM10011490_03540 [Pseudoclavibacter endophyticus]